eukprot:9189099-Pyramimonas_sp.AAC.1
MEVWCTEPREERELSEATPSDDLYTVPTYLITDNSVLVTVAEEQRGHLPTCSHPRDSDIEETYYVPLYSTDEDHSYGLHSDKN